MEYEPRVNVIHQSLLQPRLLYGVERALAIMNMTIIMVFIMGLRIVAYAPFGILLHVLFAYLTKIDDKYVKAYLLYNRQADIYEPWPVSKQKINERPHGFSKGMLH